MVDGSKFFSAIQWSLRCFQAKGGMSTVVERSGTAM